jgi:hypothetical protein
LELPLAGALVIALERRRVVEKALDEILVGDDAVVGFDLGTRPSRSRRVLLKSRDELELGAADVF